MEQLQDDVYGRKVEREIINNSFFKYHVTDIKNNSYFSVESPLEKNLFEVYRTIEGMAPYVEPTPEELPET